MKSTPQTLPMEPERFCGFKRWGSGYLVGVEHGLHHAHELRTPPLGRAGILVQAPRRRLKRGIHLLPGHTRLADEEWVMYGTSAMFAKKTESWLV